MQRMSKSFIFLTVMLLLFQLLDQSDAFVKEPLSFFGRVQMPSGGPYASSTALYVLDFENLASNVLPQLKLPNLNPQASIESTGQLIAAVAQKQGPLAMVLAVALTDSVPLVPTQPISIIAGAVFGLPIGLASVIAGQTIATVFAILFGRYVLARRGNDWQAEILNTTEEVAITQSSSSDDNKKTKLAKVFAELTSGLNSDDWKTVFGTILLARQSPVLPFSLGNYFIGASTDANILVSVAATVVGCLPLNLLWVGAGAGGMAAVDMVNDNGMLAESLEVAGILATTAIVLSIAKVVFKVWNEEENVVSG